MANVLGTKVVTQIGILCHDIEKTAKAYGDFFGLEYAIYQTDVPEIAKGVYNGAPTPARCWQAFPTPRRWHTPPESP